MADFTDFNWQTGDYGEAAKFNAMVDNDRHLRQRTDVQSFHWARSETVAVGFLQYRIVFGGSIIAQGDCETTPSDISRVNLDVSAIPIGLRVFQVQARQEDLTWDIIVARIFKHAGINYASFWATFLGSQRYVRNVSLALHRQWQSW